MSKKKQQQQEDDEEEWEDNSADNKKDFIPIVALKRVREGDLVRVKPKGHTKWLDGKVKRISYLDDSSIGTGRAAIESLTITYPCNCYRTAKYAFLILQLSFFPLSAPSPQLFPNISSKLFLFTKTEDVVNMFFFSNNAVLHGKEITGN